MYGVQWAFLQPTGPAKTMQVLNYFSLCCSSRYSHARCSRTNEVYGVIFEVENKKGCKIRRAKIHSFD
jgi:hypothetical protein